jgi:fumarate hydratase, class II
MPLIARNLLESIRLLARASGAFARLCIAGIEADEAKCAGYVERSLAMCAALAPVIGYDKAAAIAKRAHETGRTVREVALEMSGLEEARLEGLLHPGRQAGGG